MPVEGQTQLLCSGQSRRVGWQMGGVSEINPVASGRYLADCGWLTYHAASRLALYKGKAGEGGSTARTPRAISCNDEEKEEQDKEAAFNKSSSSRLAA